MKNLLNVVTSSIAEAVGLKKKNHGKILEEKVNRLKRRAIKLERMYSILEKQIDKALVEGNYKKIINILSMQGRISNLKINTMNAISKSETALTDYNFNNRA